jgi:hypothetical protein
VVGKNIYEVRERRLAVAEGDVGATNVNAISACICIERQVLNPRRKLRKVAKQTI